MSDAAALLTATAAILGVVLGIPGYFRWRSRRDKAAAVGEAFEAVVRGLGSGDEVERLAGAVRLRRFFDPQTELGQGGTPYAAEAVNVIAAILRRQEAGDLQKLLADGLAFAPSLEGADLQRTNLQRAYLGARPDRVVSLRDADFFRADLTGASLKGATAAGAVFYQSLLRRTVFKNADLRGANFFEADLLDARFEGAALEGATFADARNVPAEVLAGLDAAGVHRGAEGPSAPAAEESARERPLRIFVSEPGRLSPPQRQAVARVEDALRDERLELRRVGRDDYPVANPIGEVCRAMSGCDGVLVIGLRQLEIERGVWRRATAEEAPVADQASATPWNQVEAGIAVGLDLPVLVLRDAGVVGGVFDPGSAGDRIHLLDLDTDDASFAFRQGVADWLAAVRERARTGGPGG